MPLSALGEVVVGVVIELFGNAFATGALAGVGAVSDAAREAGARRAERARERALALADIVILAAFYDAKVTEAERAALAQGLEPRFDAVGADVTVDELVERWSGPRMALSTDDAYGAAVRSLAEDLEPSDRTQTFAAVVTVLGADAARGPTPAAPFRGREDLGDPRRAMRLFGEALGIASKDVEVAIAARR
jgi:hypothetical protein